MSNKTYFYVSGNTAAGLVNYLQSNVQDIEQVIILKHPSHTLKTTILENMLGHFESDYHIEVICSAHGEAFLEGLIIREQSLAIVTDTITADQPVHGYEIDLQEHLKNAAINGMNEYSRITNLVDSAYVNFATGLMIHDDLEQVYIDEMDFSKADKLAEDFIVDLLNDVPKQERDPHIYHRLFGTNTGDGAVNVVPELIEHLSKRYYVKGRAGTGKSVFMNKVAKACEDRGLNIELYHCSFDPKSIDMVLVPELDICLFDSTDPHEFSPEHDEDVVIDLYEKTVTQGTDEKFATEINDITQKYKSYMKKGIQDLREASNYERQLEQKYMKDIDEESINKIIRFIYQRIK